MAIQEIIPEYHSLPEMDRVSKFINDNDTWLVAIVLLFLFVFGTLGTLAIQQRARAIRMECINSGHQWTFLHYDTAWRSGDYGDIINVYRFRCDRCKAEKQIGKSQMTDALWSVVERDSPIRRPL